MLAAVAPVPAVPAPASQRLVPTDGRSDLAKRNDLLSVHRYFFICDMLSSELAPFDLPADADMFQHRSAFRVKGSVFPFFLNVRVCGTVIERREDNGALRVMMDDMTGVLEVRMRRGVAHAKRLAKIEKGATVEFLGELKDEGGRRWVDSSIFNVKPDPLHIILGPLRTIQKYQTSYSPDSYPEVARAYSQKMTQFQAQGPSQILAADGEEEEFISALEDIGWPSDIGLQAVPADAAAPKADGDIEFDDDLDFDNLMNVDFDAAALAAAQPPTNAAQSVQPQQQPQPAEPRATPSFDDFPLDMPGDDFDALFGGDVPMQAPAAGSRMAELCEKLQAFIGQGGGARKAPEVAGMFGSLGWSPAEINEALDQLMQNFVVYRDGEDYRLM